jgi:hypothetical protein
MLVYNYSSFLIQIALQGSAADDQLTLNATFTLYIQNFQTKDLWVETPNTKLMQL